MRSLVYLGILALFSLFLPLGISPLFDLDEGAFSEATREMLESGNYITTYLNGDLRFDKPILIYWLQAFSVKIFGLNEFALRLPSALSALFWALAIWFFVRKIFDGKIAYFSTAVMISSLQIALISKAAIADALLNLTIALSLFFIWYFLENRKNLYLYLAFASMGLGVLTKGPVAVMVPFVTTLIYLIYKKDLKLFLKMIFNPIGIAIFLLIAAPWYIAEYLDQGDKFLNGFLFKHNLERFSRAFESHKGGVFYYIPVLIFGLMPFTASIFTFIKGIKTYIKADIFVYLLIWFTFVFVFFSLSGTKLPHYVIYGYTPLFILIGYEQARRERVLDYLYLSFVLVFIFLLMILPNISEFIKPHNAYIEEILGGVKEVFTLEYQLFALVVLIVIALLPKLRISKETKVFLLSLMFIVFVNFGVIRSYGKLAQEPIKEAALYAKKKGYDVILYHFNKPSFLVYMEKKSIKKEPQKGDVVLLDKKHLKKFKDYEVKYTKYGVYLIKLK